MEVAIVLALGAAVVIFIMIAKAKAGNEWEEQLNKTLTGFQEAQYKHIDSSSKTAIAVNTQLQKVCLVQDSRSKSYAFNEIRNWETNLETAGQIYGAGVNVAIANMKSLSAAKRNTGLFLQVKDIDQPVWQIMFPDDTKANLAKWMEILRQTLNEGKQ